MAVIKTAKSTGGLGNAALPNILSCIAVRRDTKPSAGNVIKSNTAINFFGFVIVFTSFLFVYELPALWGTGESSRDTLPIFEIPSSRKSFRVQKTSPILTKTV